MTSDLQSPDYKWEIGQIEIPRMPAGVPYLIGRFPRECPRAMKTEFRKAVVPREMRSLLAFDAKVFPKADRFPKEQWLSYDSYWLIVDGVKVGCCAFERHAKPGGTLYITTTGILPRFQGLGFGQMLKCWEIAYARFHGFTRIVTNTRKNNAAMIRLNKKLGFRVVRITRHYYTEPPDSTVVMELKL